MITNARVISFGNISEETEATARNTVLCDLSHFGVIQFDGEDAPGFLQGQLSNDVTKVNPALGQITAYCSPKGRVMANALLLLTAAGYWMQLPQELVEPIRKRLSMFILRSKVNITDLGEKVITLGISGARAAEILQKVIGATPTTTYEIKMHGHCRIVNLGLSRFELLAPINEAQVLWQRIAAHARPVGSACWDWLTIRAGIAVITTATQEQFVPQMINFEIVNGVSFDKGCYPGQEIVARTKYLGKLTRRMFLAHIQSQVSPQANDALFSPDMGDQPCGTVVNSAPAPGGGFDMLAVLLIKSAVNNQIHLNSLEGATLEFLDLPYALSKTD
jgi:tRNA-modifying protein YgfZ